MKKLLIIMTTIFLVSCSSASRSPSDNSGSGWIENQQESSFWEDREIQRY